MSKFCTYCGKSLGTEENCNCKSDNSKNEAGGSNTKSQPPYNHHLFQNCVDLFVNTLKSPITTLKIFVKNIDFKAAIMMIIVESLVFSIVPILYQRSVQSITYFDIGFIITCLFMIAFCFLLTFGMASITSLFAKLYLSAVCQKTITFKQGLCVAGAKSIGKILFLFVAIWFMLISQSLAFHVIFLGSVFGWILALRVVGFLAKKNKNRSIYAGFLTFACVYLCWSVIFTVFPIFKSGYTIFF